MKYILFFLWITYLIWWIYILGIFSEQKNEEINIEEIKKSLVIIVPEAKLISYKNNPKWAFEEYQNSWIWLWFIINSSWSIQTVNHIVEDKNINYKALNNNKEYSLEKIYENKNEDKAILKLINNNINYFSLIIKNNIKINNNETIYSFWVNPENLEIIYNTWIIINKKSKLENMSNLLEISNNIQPGFSGWPIINLKWEVIWINYAISDWKKYWIKLP